MPEVYDNLEYLPSTPSLTTSLRRAATRSQTREDNARNSALLLTPPRTVMNNAPPLTSPHTIYQYGKSRNRRLAPTQPNSSEGLQVATPIFTAGPTTSSSAPAGDVAVRHATLPTSNFASSTILRDNVTSDSQVVVGPQPGSSTSSFAASVDDMTIYNTTTPIPTSSTTLHGDCGSEEAKTAFDSNLGLSRRSLPEMSFHGQAAKAIVMIGETCNDIRAMNTHIGLLEDRLATKDKQLVETEALLLEIIKARNDAMMCPILGIPAVNMYITSACGHLFSEEGLHTYLKHQVITEFRRLSHFYPNITEASLKKRPFNRNFLLFLHNRTRQFKPSFQCGYCRTAMTVPPVKCWAATELGMKIDTLTNVKHDERTASFACGVVDYFVFHARRP